MIHVKKNVVKVKIPKSEKKNKEALLIAELGVALIEVARTLKKDREDVLSALTLGVMITKELDCILDKLEEELEKEESNG